MSDDNECADFDDTLRNMLASPPVKHRTPPPEDEHERADEPEGDEA